jgi:hypothetical protein|tara:strand:- start:13867 stop:14034 length:168 start_codon:yes stop_codon:yes gene_type:complete
MKQARLEALKLALTHGVSPEKTLEIAELYFKYIEEGAKIVELPKQKTKLTLKGNV